MAAQPRASAADVESLLEPIERAAVQVNNVVAEGQSILERNTVLMNQALTYLEQRDSAREQGRHNDQNVTPIHQVFAEYQERLRLANHRLANQDEGLRPLLQHQRNNLDPLEFGLNAHPSLSPQLRGAANEQPISGGCGRRGSTPYDAADEEMVSGQHMYHPNISALPYRMPEDRVISDNERRAHTQPHARVHAQAQAQEAQAQEAHAHGHRFGDNRHPFLTSDFAPGSFLNTTHDPRDPHLRQRLHRGLDTGHYDVSNLGPQPTRGLEARLDNIYDDELAMAPRPDQRNVERAHVRTPQHHSTDYPFPDDHKDNGIRKDLCEARARQTLEPRSTRHLAPLESPGFLPAPTVLETGHWSSLDRTNNGYEARRRRLQQMWAQNERDQERLAARWEEKKRKAGRIARSPRPAPNLFNDDLEQLPHHRCDVPFRPHKKDTVRVCTARRDGSDYPNLPGHLVQQVDDPNQPRVATAMSTALAKAATEDTFHGQQHAQGPVVNAKRSNTTHKNSVVRDITNSSNNDENRINPSHPSTDSSESSESGYDTPDFDDSPGAGDEDMEDAEGLGWVGM